MSELSGIFFQPANPGAAKQRSKVEQCSPYRCKHRLRICSAPASRDRRDFLLSRVKTFTLVASGAIVEENLDRVASIFLSAFGFIVTV